MIPARSACPIACALDLLGDRWTLLIVRDLLTGKRRYGEFQASAEGIPTNILADRLRRLEEAGLVGREPYQQKPVRHAYHLTAKGKDLKRVVGSIALWSIDHLTGTRPNPELVQLLKAEMTGRPAR